jgi:predicted ribonuclease YlaK
MSFKTLFIDTNIFLHYQSFDEINWLEILDVDQVEICLPSIVIQELDKHKYSSSSKLRDKASKVIKKLHKLADAGLKTNLKPNIGLYFEVSNKSFDFIQLGLDSSSQDDRLIASILLFRADNPEKLPILVAADLGLRLKAKYRQIEAICLPDELKLVAELDQTEKRIKELEQEVLELQRRIPKLELCFPGKTDRLTCKVESFLPESFNISILIHNRIEQLKQEYPKILEGQSKKQFNNPSAMTIGDMYESDTPEILPAEISNYNKKLDEFYENHKQYLKE